ncbi:MAG: septum formation initiator family protein [bacterium]|nr:septum formation initiator family protein [Candidatus Jorgensenbacteria bacterium]
MKILKLSILFLGIAILLWTGYSLIQQKRAIEREIRGLSDVAKKLTDENKSVEGGIAYFGRTENLIKESRSKFNLKVEGEQMFIVVPDDSSTTATSTKK